MTRCLKQKHTLSAHGLTAANNCWKWRDLVCESKAAVASEIINWSCCHCVGRAAEGWPAKEGSSSSQTPTTTLSADMSTLVSETAKQVVLLELLRKTRWRGPPREKKDPSVETWLPGLSMMCAMCVLRLAMGALPANLYAKPESSLALWDRAGRKPSGTSQMEEKKHQDGRGSRGLTTWPHKLLGHMLGPDKPWKSWLGQGCPMSGDSKQVMIPVYMTDDEEKVTT